MITNEVIANCATSFWDNVISNLPYNLLVIFKVNHGNIFFSISYAKLITDYTDINDFIQSCQTYWSIRDEYYHSLNIDNIILSYKRYDGKVYDHLLISHKFTSTSVQSHTYKGKGINSLYL